VDVRARPVVGSVAVTIGAAVTVLGSSMAWLRTGQRRRSSFEMFGLLERLGFLPRGGIGWAIRLWPVVPLLAVAAAVLAWTVRGWPLRVLALVTLLYAGGVGFAVASADEQSFVFIEYGPMVTAAGASMLMIGALVATSRTRSRDRAARRGAPSADRS
jgi:hypothetical protein